MLNLAISQIELAEIAEVTKGAAWHWVHEYTPIPVSRCPAIERATAGRVMRWDLRPADWHLIWPELIDRPDAPPLPSPIPPIPAPSEPKPKRGRPRRKTALGLVGLKGGFEPQTPAEKLAAAGIEHQGGG